MYYSPETIKECIQVYTKQIAHLRSQEEKKRAPTSRKRKLT